MYLSKSDILEAKDIESEDVKVPEWGKDAKVLVFGLTSHEKDLFEEGLIATDSSGKRSVNIVNATARLCALCIRDKKAYLHLRNTT